ncbi:DUF397 domain-containing protein [Streptomyces acidiscabies]|uniref:DUF397 domain-containing protein n=1 Tax=Streptomyces acidiscabies TaxID=42234 RepID=A0AAP6BLR1_9ACTN|nr:DUF397 domain-containing protein [Streptomyces acidiscabies]MBP5938290.1 DUF397 domain-containing protein [Streptomyces sp. LBUM 1476]MBZ3909315.1 DUF397 domain-containing protein [Streptomyces acidiscabies]MDX2967005.1 DUF397 domain-containing protein [Streptomyces acidiscabies]MDX3016277.1 DUF397 domain-containing protein [Streptomyces acidiscabies]MDX3796874.1 DUF397 domain-containing protein [Streptomyces acidiscabies]
MSTEHPLWFTSSYSSNGGQCVEVATNLAASHGMVPVRDSKNQSGPALNVRPEAFTAFLSALNSPEFGGI